MLVECNDEFLRLNFEQSEYINEQNGRLATGRPTP